MELATERLVLRELVESDAQRVFEIESIPSVWRYLPRYPESIDDAEAYVLRSIVGAQAMPRLVHDFAITKDGAMIGRSGMVRGDTDPRDAMIWYVLDPAHHGHGYATEAARAVVTYAFDTLRLHRVWADVDPRNPASLRVVERLGMRKEAHHVENVCIRGEWCDTVIYALLRREWEAR